MRKVTRKDVALEAGVSETVVSYVLNSNRPVDGRKKARVLEAVRKLGYVPSPAARSLKGKAARHILFVVDDLVSEYFGSIMGELEKLVVGQGYLFSLASDRGDEGFVDTLCRWSFDGIIIGSATISCRDIQRIIDTGMPTVILAMNEYPRFKGRYGLVDTGLRQGVHKAMACLRERRRRRIAYVDAFKVDGPDSDSPCCRLCGYLDCLDGQDALVIDGCADSAALAKKLSLAFSHGGFDALVCRNDRMAAECMLVLSSMGLAVPDDVSLVGVDDSRIALYTTPRLTSLAIRKADVASSTMDLFSRIRSGNDCEVLTTELECDLVIRSSV